MKASLHTRYGPPEELQIQEVAKPVPQDNEVLVRIHATSVTTSDCNVRNFTFVPQLFVLPMRLQYGGLTKPQARILGMDFAGEVVAVGRTVERFEVGDQVFGTSESALGAHAEYICLPEDQTLAAKPLNLTYEEAAAVPLAANTALYFIRDLGAIRPGQKVLINGASGGIGTFAVQLAKYYGAEVTGVCSTANVDLVKSLGADRVLDYTREAAPPSGESYDVIFDVAGKLPFSRCRHALRETGTYLVTLPTAPVLLAMLGTSIMGRRKIKVGSAMASIENLLFLKALLEAGTLRPVIDRRYPLEQIAEAFRYVEKGHKQGNVVIIVDHPDRQGTV